jgi:Brp/Blh family beta-carotene 15,15'-monooxygenase
MAMKKIILLLLGLILLLVQHYIVAIKPNTQYLIFIVGILLLGVPHGAADLLVAERNASLSEKVFSKQKFFIVYLGRLVMFACILFLFPVAGNILFILFAAYHFGETDLHQFKTNTLPGKIFVISYGLVILSVILLHHFDDVKPIYLLFESGKENQAVINWISQNRYYILSFNGILFFISAFIYFLMNKHLDNNDTGQFLVRFACVLFILFNLPMLVGFTFYFVVWHSLLSLNNIVIFLRKKNTVSYKIIIKQILLYSFLAIFGIVLFGLTGFMFINANAIAGYIFLSLAVLTAPHMEIMYGMYMSIRQNRDEAII